MKTLRMIGGMLAAVCLCFCMASCSEDDGDGDGGSDSSISKNSARLDNKTFKTPYGFWHNGGQDTEEMDDNIIMMEFYSYNPKSGKFPGKASVVLIEYKAPTGQKEITSTVLKGGEYHIYVVHDATMSSEGLQCETKYRDTSNPDLKIVRNGNKYSISVENATLADEERDYDFSFNYSGKLTNIQIAE